MHWGQGLMFEELGREPSQSQPTTFHPQHRQKARYDCGHVGYATETGFKVPRTCPPPVSDRDPDIPVIDASSR